MALSSDPLLPRPLLSRVASRNKKGLILVVSIAAVALVLGTVMLSNKSTQSSSPIVAIGGGYEQGGTGAYWYPQWADNADMAKERVYGTGAPGMCDCVAA
jgi:hypothetical protein